MPTAPALGPAEGSSVPAAVSVPDRICGRCRKSFDGDPDAHPTAQAGWWACATCRESLLGPVVKRP